MKPNNYTKKGFTLTELAIVIAIIAVLIAVLVPTFVSLINKANESSDKVLVSNLNKSLSITDEPDMVEIDSTKSLYNVTTAITSVRGDGYDVTKLSPTADGGDIVYNASTNKFIYYSNNFAELSYGEEPSSDDVLVVITDTTLSRYGIAESDSSKIKDNTIHYCVYTTDSNVTITNTTTEEITVWVYTESGSLATINIPNGTIYHNGACTFASITCADNSYHPMATIKGVEMQKGRYVKHVLGSVSYIYVDSENASNVTLEDVDTSETKVYSNESSVSIVTSSSDGSSSTVSADNIYTEASNYYNNASAYSSLEDLFVSYTVVTAATCENNGEGVFITLFGTEVTVELSATDHNYDVANIAWAWSDDYSSATATITCQNDTSHTQTINATVSSATITAATCSAGGSEQKTATITYSGNTYSDIKTVDTSVKDHTYGTEKSTSYVLDGTVYTDGTIHVCSECGSWEPVQEGSTDCSAYEGDSYKYYNTSITSKWLYDEDGTTLIRYFVTDDELDYVYSLENGSYKNITIEVPYGTTAIADGIEDYTDEYSTYKSVSGAFSIDFTYLSIESIKLPDTLTYIGAYAFYDQKCLTSIEIPASVTYIGEYAFESCTGLTTIIIDENSVLTTISSYAFSTCSALTSIVIPASIEGIDATAFNTISNSFSKVYYCGTTEEWSTNIGDNVFKDAVTIYYYSADEPTESGVYWRYVEDSDGNKVPTVWTSD